jgi:outer membrane protein assembly factor BamE (lipoprotein component of BamABCDE complex)
MRQEITFYSIVRGWAFLLVCLATALLWTACQTTPIRDFTKVVPNMSKDEVLNIIGSPNRTERYDGKEKWAYRFWTGDDHNVEALRQVTFVSGRVVSVGEDTEEEERIKEIQEDDSKRAERRKAAKAKALMPVASAPPTTPEVKVEVSDPPPRIPTESDFVEQKGKRGAVTPEE